MNTVEAWKMSELSCFLKVKRSALDLGIRAAAKDIGISPTTLSKIESGHIPDFVTLEKVLNWMGYEAAFYDTSINQ